MIEIIQLIIYKTVFQGKNPRRGLWKRFVYHQLHWESDFKLAERKSPETEQRQSDNECRAEKRSGEGPGCLLELAAAGGDTESDLSENSARNRGETVRHDYKLNIEQSRANGEGPGGLRELAAAGADSGENWRRY